MLKLAISLVVLATVFCGISAIHFTDCGSKDGTFSAIEISDCDTAKSACILKRNSNVSITIHFTTTTTSPVVSAIVHGVLAGLEVPFPLPNGNGCIDSGLTCPITSGNDYVYVATLPVLNEYPKIRVQVKWELKDESNNNIICVMIPAKLE